MLADGPVQQTVHTMGGKSAKRGSKGKKPAPSTSRVGNNANSSSELSALLQIGDEAYFSGLADRIATLVEKMGRTPLSRLAGVPVATIDNWTRRKSKPNPHGLTRLAAAAETDPTWLLTGIGDPSPPLPVGSKEGRQQLATTQAALLAAMDQLAVAVAAFLPLADAPARGDFARAVEHLQRLTEDD